LPGDLIAAFLWAQLQDANRIINERMQSWQNYHELLEDLEIQGKLRRPIIPEECAHNAHMYYILLASGADRQRLLDDFRRNEISAVFHYVPLHSSPAGKRYGRAHGSLDITNTNSERLIRLPLWQGVTDEQQTRVIEILRKF
jgi:dTDP-4-amino-4,6-dideoxygalactose transaminase